MSKTAPITLRRRQALGVGEPRIAPRRPERSGCHDAVLEAGRPAKRIAVRCGRRERQGAGSRARSGASCPTGTQAPAGGGSAGAIPRGLQEGVASTQTVARIERSEMRECSPRISQSLIRATCCLTSEETKAAPQRSSCPGCGAPLRCAEPVLGRRVAETRGCALRPGHERRGDHPDFVSFP